MAVNQTKSGSGDNVGRDKIVNNDQSAEKIYNIEKIEGDAYFHYNQPKEPLPKELTSIPAYNPNKLLGRKEKLEEIDSILSSEESIVLLKGIGGIGKTTILQAYIKTALYYEKYNHIAWLTISQDIQTHIFQSFSRPEIFQYDDKVAREINYKNLIRKLHDLQGNKLLILDNANNT